MGLDHPTRTDSKVESTDQPKPSDKPPGPPPDNPGAPGYPSRRESLARARESAPQESGTQQVAVKDSGARGTETRDNKPTSAQAEKDESTDPETPDGEEDAVKPEEEAGGSDSGEEAEQDGQDEQDEGVGEDRSESEEVEQTDAEPGDGESKDERDGKLAEAQTKSVGERTETPDEPAFPKRQPTMPADNPGSPNQPSRLESLARARELVQPESSSPKTETTDTGDPPPAEPAVEPASPPPENGDSKTERPQEQESTPQQDEKPGTGEPSPALESGGEDARDVVEGVAREPESEPEELLGNDLSAGSTSEPDGLKTPNRSDDVGDDRDKRISGEETADDNSGMDEFDDDVLERGISDRLKQFAAKLDRSAEPKELKGTVDRPHFQDPEEKPQYVPDRYGTPLERADGSRIPLFNGELAREQAKQGILGDCGIIAAFGAIAEKHPEAIRNCVRETGDGNYEVRFREAKYSKSKQRYEPTGKSITLTVTPDLPIKDNRPQMPAFAAITSANAAWAPVLEKALAGLDQMWSPERRDRANRLWKERGKSGDAPTGYVRLNQGTGPSERAKLLTVLTGSPAKAVAFPTGYDNQGRSADRRLQDEIAGHLSQGKPVLVGTRELSKGETHLPKKLIAKHVYEVTKVDDQGKFHLHNPWNKTHPHPMTIKELRANMRQRYTTME
ncbi:C2 family cysteine protease [Actinomadura luteofluorescens]|uniref:C2 family cysteine protease n=1 Tax=Actinomadura luteofluorescens TaxID=46163 RepID=UPI0030D1731F